MRIISSQVKYQVSFKQQNSGVTESPRSKEDIDKKADPIDIYDCNIILCMLKSIGRMCRTIKWFQTLRKSVETTNCLS